MLPFWLFCSEECSWLLLLLFGKLLMPFLWLGLLLRICLHSLMVSYFMRLLRVSSRLLDRSLLLGPDTLLKPVNDDFLDGLSSEPFANEDFFTTYPSPCSLLFFLFLSIEDFWGSACWDYLRDNQLHKFKIKFVALIYFMMWRWPKLRSFILSGRFWYKNVTVYLVISEKDMPERLSRLPFSSLMCSWNIANRKDIWVYWAEFNVSLTSERYSERPYSIDHSSTLILFLDLPLIWLLFLILYVLFIG